MANCFVDHNKNSIPVTVLTSAEFENWLTKQNPFTQSWLQDVHYKAEAGNTIYLPNEQGKFSRVLCCINDSKNFWGVGNLPLSLPEGIYELEVMDTEFENFAIAWGLGAYQFTRYKKSNKNPSQLFLDKNKNSHKITNIVESIYWVRDLINTPTDDMGPTELSAETKKLAKQYRASFSEVVGDKLLKENYASIHTVGRASDDEPRLLDLRWGNTKNPKITLVGKGVCFDTGGLDLKSSNAMLLMKKDMGGAAHALGLARMIMEANLAVNLRVLIPAVENSVSGNAYRPGDVITSRKGLTIEVGNTDAEGRVVLADALTEAAREKPDLIIDLSTLTGAARIALGTEIAALFSNDDKLAQDITYHSEKQSDPIWRLPLFSQYRDSLNSSIADINNATSDSYAGAITAALFLKEFVPDDISWVHFDMMAWNLKSRPGRPAGGEAMALRALFSYLSTKYQ